MSREQVFWLDLVVFMLAICIVAGIVALVASAPHAI